ncbi:MAG TPA: hypothetical protein DEO36_07820 [Flavobacteriaceae bacterium]|nr:hypothetical protein [Flavobacteriaceae bacterium]
MKTYVLVLSVLICLTAFSCSTASKISKRSNHNKSSCKDLVWYHFINDKPNKYYLDSAKKVAKKWGFKIVYELGSGANSDEDKQRKVISKEKSIPLFKCLTKNYGENWRNKFREEVKIEINQ